MKDPAGYTEMMQTNKIPKIKLNREQIARSAEALGAVVYASSLPGAYLIRDDEEVIIITHSNGYLRLRKANIEDLIEELANIQEDMNR